MRIACIQMDHLSPDPDQNFKTVSERIAETAKTIRPDVVTLPEMWNSGYFPREELASASDVNGERTIKLLSALSKEYSVNIVGGSVSDRRDGAIYNTAYVFDRNGQCVCRYDKIHLLSRYGESLAYRAGDTFGTFFLDGVRCAAVICYDVRFPELCRAVAEPPTKVLFVCSQWPHRFTDQFSVLMRARAIENGIFTVGNTSTPPNRAGQHEGGSMIVGPQGSLIAFADPGQDVIFADLDLDAVDTEQGRKPVWKDRRPDLFH